MDAQSVIELCRTGFFVSVAVAVLGLVLTVFFFFRFRIGDIWAIRTGRAQRKAVQMLQEASRNDGRMRQEESIRQIEINMMSGTGAETTESLTGAEAKSEFGYAAQELQATMLLAGTTTVLTPPEESQGGAFGETADLGYGATDDLCYGNTTVLQPAEINQITVLNQSKANTQKKTVPEFVITQQIVLIHTTEKIL